MSDDVYVPILPALPIFGLAPDEVENDHYIRCLAPDCSRVFDKYLEKYEDFASHMHVHEMAEALAEGEDYLPEADDGVG